MDAAAILLGVFIWALKIVIAYTFGPILFSGSGTVLIVFMVSGIVAAAVMRVFFGTLAIVPEDRLTVAALVAAPLMILDIGLILVAPVLGETFSGAAGRAFVAWMVLTPTIILAVGIRMRRPAL